MQNKHAEALVKGVLLVHRCRCFVSGSVFYRLRNTLYLLDGAVDRCSTWEGVDTYRLHKMELQKICSGMFLV